MTTSNIFDRKPWIPAQRPGSGADLTGDGATQRVLLIVELANAHEGRAADALQMVQAAAEAGCDAVKFQKYYADEMLAAGHSQMQMFANWEWEESAWRELIETAQGAGLKVFIDVFGVRAYQSLADLPPVDGLKIHSADVNNLPLLDLLADTICPILIGTGGCSDLDIYLALTRLGRPERLVLMHGYQAFPTPLEDTALRRIPYLLESFGVAVGLSDHLDADDSFGRAAPLMAIPLGVCCIEKHLTLNRAARGVDSASALNPDEMREFVQWVRQAEIALGRAELPPSVSEAGYRRRFKKSVITTQLIARGQTVTADHLAYQMVENPPRYSLTQAEVVGLSLHHDIPAGTVLSARDLNVKAGLCLIARLKSQRLPRKALVDIHGKPAIVHLFERAKLCHSVERAVLCTSTHPEDAPLIHLARAHGLTTYAGSPEQPLERMVACAEMYGWQYVIRATADNIFLDPDLLAQAVALATERNLDYVSMRSVPVGTHCEVFSLSVLRIIQQYAEAPYTTEYLTWFIADNPSFRSMDLPVPEALQRNYRLTLDTSDDLQNIREVVDRLTRVPSPYELSDVIRAVEADPDLQRRCTFVPSSARPPAKVRFKFNVYAT